MRIHLSLLALTALGSTAIAQNQFEMQGYTTSFTSRGNIGSGTGELLQGIHTNNFLGLGENGSDVNIPPVAVITQLSVVHQDQNGSTPETFDFVVRSGTDATGPDISSGGIIAEFPGLALPASTTNGAVAWIQTFNLTTSGQFNVPTDDFWSVGSRLGPAPNWTADGHSQHTSFGSAAFPNQNSWNEYVIANFAETAWQITSAATVATNPSNQRTWRYRVGSDAVTLQMGCGTTGAPGIGYGMGGPYPAFTGTGGSSTPLGIHARVRGGSTMAGAASVVALAPLGIFPIPIPLGTGANIYINTGAMFLFFGPAADPNGQADVQIAAAIPSLGLNGALAVPFQAALDAPSTGIRISNVAFVNPQ